MDPHWPQDHDDTYNGAHPSQNQSQYLQPYEDQPYEHQPYEDQPYEDRCLDQAGLYANQSYASEDQQLAPALGQSLDQAGLYADQSFAYDGQRLNPAQRHNYSNFDLPLAGDNNLYHGSDLNNRGDPLVGSMNHDLTPSGEDFKPMRNGPSYDRTRRTQPVEDQVEDEDEDQDEGEELELTIISMTQFRQEAGKRIAEAVESKSRALAKEHKQIDFPESDAEQLKCVKKLVAAINNTIDIEDKPCRNGRASQSAQRFSRGYYPAEAIELCAWGILDRLRMAELGVVLTEPHHGYRREEYASFEGRFMRVVSTLRSSKAICKQLLDPNYADRFCDAPDFEMQMKINNKKVNSERDHQNQIGRSVIKGTLAPEEVAKLKAPERDDVFGPSSRRNHAHRRPDEKLLSYTPKNHEKRKAASKTPGSASKTKTSTPRSRKSRARVKQEEDDESEEALDDDDDDDDEEGDGYFATPGTVEPRGSSKRKVKTVSYAEGDNGASSDGESSYEPAADTPTKRPRTGRAVGRTPNRSLASGPPSMGSSSRVSRQVSKQSSEPFTPSPMRGPRQMGSHNGARRQAPPTFPLMSQQSVPAPTTGNAQPGMVYDPNAELRNMSPQNFEVYDAYREIVAGLLGMTPEEGRLFTLSDLRRYARAFNNAFRNVPYYDSRMPSLSFSGRQAIAANGSFHFFASQNSVLREIAIVRGDMDTSGNEIAYNRRGGVFNTQGEGPENRALGAVDNEFGVATDLYRHRHWASDHFGNQFGTMG